MHSRQTGFTQSACGPVTKNKERIKKLLMYKKFLKERNSKPNKIWVDKGSEFYNRSMKSVLKK